MIVVYNTKPDTILYMPLPNGNADVWLRKNIQATKDDDGNTVWTAEEVYFRTALDRETVTANIETLYANGGVTDGIADVAEAPTTEDRLDAIEAAILELAEVMANG